MIRAHVLGCVLAVGATLCGAGFSAAQGVRSAAPGLVPGETGSAFTGCWQNDAPLYDDYSVAFCAQPNGTGLYRVQGGGYDCQGRSTWTASGGGRRFVYQMSRGSCGAEANWTADRIECALARAERLACTYVPNAQGFSPARFSAARHPDARRR